MRAFPFSASGALGPGVAASGGSTLLRGLIVTEVAGSPALARINIRDGGVVGGSLLLPVMIAASGTARVDFADPLLVNGQVYVQVQTGTVVGSVFID